ncbi:MAG: DNA methyltransferase [Bacteroidota bacterium]
MTNVRTIKEVEFILKNINWSFYPKPITTSDKIHPFNCRKYHWYPATFIPEIPFTLIEILSLPGAKIYDPFVGIGTTFIQALLLNRIPFGTDISSVSIEFIKSLLILFNPKTNLDLVNETILKDLGKFKSDINYFKILENSNENLQFENLKVWYTEEIFNALCFLVHTESKHQDIPTKAVYRITISSLLSMLSRQDRGWGCIADNVKPKVYQINKIDAINKFNQTALRLIKDIANIKNICNGDILETYQFFENNETIFRSDVMDSENIKSIIPSETIDLVITSPPYPNMADYTTSQRLSHYYFDNDINLEKGMEIGARHRRASSNSLMQYKSDMLKANESISNVLKKNALACFIMPSFNSDNEKNSLRKIVVQEVMANIETLGLTKELEIERIIPNVRRAHNLKWATLEKELIHIYKKI